MSFEDKVKMYVDSVVDDMCERLGRDEITEDLIDDITKFMDMRCKYIKSEHIERVLDSLVDNIERLDISYYGKVLQLLSSYDIMKGLKEFRDIGGIDWDDDIKEINNDYTKSIYGVGCYEEEFGKD